VIASRVFISDHYHGDTSLMSLETPPVRRPLTSRGPVIIEDSVLIGEGVVILSNVRIGRCSVIGANSVVTKNIPPFSIVAGVPGKVIRSVQ
jgi:acetyltransferase-like isoleucine patch superfamily enzyme